MQGTLRPILTVRNRCEDVDFGEKRNERDTGVILQEVEVLKIDEFTYHPKQ